MPRAEASAVAVPSRVQGWMRLVRPTDALGVGALIVLMLLCASILSANNLSLATTGLSTAIALVGLGVVTGRAGLISLAQFGFMAIGAWFFLWLQLHAPGLSFPLAMLAAALITAPFGIAVAIPALRLRGVLFGVVTLALVTALTVYLTVKEFPGLNEGFTVAPPSWLASQGAYFRFSGAVFILVVIGTTIAARTRIGYTWLAIRYSERATAGLGRSVPMAKLSSFALSAFLGGLAGALLVGQFGIVSSDSFQPLGSLTLFALAIMVGARYPEGALIGGMLFAFMPTILTDLGLSQNYGNLLFAFGAVLGLKGGFGMAEELRETIRRRKRRRTAGAGGATDAEHTTDAQAESAPENGVGADGAGADADGAGANAGGAQPALEIKALTHKYGAVVALNDVNLSVMPGSVVALIGPNGAGKSTLIDVVSGFVRQASGEILVNGKSLDGMSASKRARAGVRRTFQQGRTIPDLTVEQYIRIGLSYAQNRRVGSDEIVRLLSFLDCPAPNTLISEIDVGTRRLIEVAAAVAARPAVVMLDEPSAGLATEESRVLGARIAAIPRLYGSAVLLVEHDMELVNAASSQVFVIDFGNVIASGPPQHVMRDSNVVQAYLGEEVTV